MARRTHEIQVPLLEDKINILDWKIAETSPATQQVFIIVRSILTLVRDKMIADKDSVQFSDYCFDICEALKEPDVTNEYARIELENLGRVFGEAVQTLRRGANTPRIKHEGGKIDGYKLEIQKILNALNAPTSPSLKESGALYGERVPQSLPTDSCDATANSASKIAMESLIRRDFSPNQLSSLIEAIFTCEDAAETIRHLPRDDAQTFVDVIDEALDRPDLLPLVRKQCLRPLYRTCGRHAFLPRSLEIHIRYDPTSNALYKGGYADVWKGEYSGRDVAVKVIRRYLNRDLQKMTGRFCKEVVAWRTLRHPNVLALIGAVMTEKTFAMISDWMANGNIREFVKANPSANRFNLLRDVANGLIYLHGQGMVHGDLKGANVLIDETGHARISDFGLLKIISDLANPSSSSSYTQGGSTRWMSPELIDPRQFGLKKSRPTTFSDCYALGMVIYETISGHVPFHQEAGPTAAVRNSTGEHPPRGLRFTNDLWEMLKKCWMFQPSDRPCIEDVLQYLEESSHLPVALYPEPGTEKDSHCGDSYHSDSTNSLSGVLNPKVDTRMPEGAIASSSLDHPAGHPVSKAHANIMGPTPWIDPTTGEICQVPLTTIGVVEDYGNSDLKTHKPDTHPDSDSHAVVPAISPPLPSSSSTTTFPPNRVEIPQRSYLRTRQYDFKPLEPIRFYTRGHPGINLGGALRQNFAGLDGRDDVLLDTGLSISCRLLFPGYPDNSRSFPIRTMNWSKARRPIPRSKLAHQVAKGLERYLTDLSRITPDGTVDECWRVGHGFMHIENMFLVSLVSVSKGSLQPEIWVAVPPTPHALAYGDGF